ncbi:MAG TPA: hypothetical protein VJJ52_01260 [Candidatus Nanoarchaeia archaeon]|nr:hypothetical protein [Candidatus Nanoarchaeia archaeon]
MKEKFFGLKCDFLRNLIENYLYLLGNPNLKMNKTLGILSGVAASAFYTWMSLVSPNMASAQEIPSAKFGNNLEQTYGVSQTPFDPQKYGEELSRRIGQNWGMYHVQPNGRVEAWGVFNNTQFAYQNGFLGHESLDLVSQSNGTNVHLVNKPVREPLKILGVAQIDEDYATIDGIEVRLGKSDFYEGFTSNETASEPLTLQQSLGQVFSYWAKQLNIRGFDGLKRAAEAVKPDSLVQKVRSLLPK